MLLVARVRMCVRDKFTRFVFYYKNNEAGCSDLAKKNICRAILVATLILA